MKNKQTVRSEIFKIIVENPGISFTGIVTEVKKGNGTVVYHLEKLRKCGKIFTRISGRKKLHWSSDHKITQDRNELSLFCQRIVKLLIAYHEGLNVGQIAEKLGASHSRVCYHLVNLESLKIIRRTHEGRRTNCVFQKGHSN